MKCQTVPLGNKFLCGTGILRKKYYHLLPLKHATLTYFCSNLKGDTISNAFPFSGYCTKVTSRRTKVFLQPTCCSYCKVPFTHTLHWDGSGWARDSCC